MIVHFLNDYMQSLSSINQLKIQNRKEAEELQNRIHNEYTNEYNVIGDIWQLISDALSFTPGPFGYLDLFLFSVILTVRWLLLQYLLLSLPMATR